MQERAHRRYVRRRMGIERRWSLAVAQTGQPACRVNIAQSAGCLFDVRLQAIDGLVELGVARPGGLAEEPDDFLAFRLQESREALL